MKLLKFTAFHIAAAALVCSQSASAQDWKKYGIDKDIPGACSYESISKKDYKGRTLNIITHAVPVIGEPTALHAKQFQELTGAKVNVVHVPFGDLFQRIMIPFQTGQNAYDVLFYGSLWIGDLNPYLEPVPKAYLDTPGMKDLTTNYRAVATWGDQMLQYPIDGDRHYMKYRKDAFENAANRKKFKEKTKRDDLMFSAFISRAAAYAKHPGVKGGFYFDLQTMEPLINSPGFVKALDMFIAAKKSFPPGGNSFGLGDEIFSFGGGQALLSYSWDDAFIQAQQSDSKIRNKVAAAPLPGSNEVWNRKTAKWDKLAAPNSAPYVTWGWTSGVSKASKSKDVAFDYLCFFSNEANAQHDLQIGRFGVNPYRSTHFEPAFWTEKLGWDKAVATSYVNTLSEMDRSKNRVFDLRVPGVNQFMTSLAAGVAEAMAGQKPSRQALDDVAKEWKRIVARVGKEKVRDAYARVVALEDNQ